MRYRPRIAVTVAAVGLAIVAVALPAVTGSHLPQRVPLNAATPTASLWQLCRDGSAATSTQPSADDSAILQSYEQSRTACDRLVDTSGLRDRDLVEALLDRADLLAPGEKDSYARALADYKRAIALAPDVAVAYWRRGKAHLLYGRNLPEALKNLDEAVRRDSSQAEFYITRASILSWLGQPNPALADLNRALSRDPRSVHALTNRAMAYFNNGDITRALADFDAALHLAPNDSGLYALRSAARRQAGDEAGAKSDEAKMAELMFGKAP
ncbi:tetratricopeptide repeat protein [Neorhizobium lilium]|uniref:tetratricopeptide repeat protein n=1 Tax=Neorhizobium lilium TaxID=2503024 RepID=UPI0013E2F92A|nr:tetratricopeptide repeat protein [Neorhizobium lilium]